jgi:drug/metabolite transporter (DMT)-like permease
VLLQLHDVWFGVVGGLASLAVFGLTAVLLRELPRGLGRFVQTIVVLLMALEAFGLAHAMRM